MGKRRPPSGRQPGRKPSGRQPPPKGGGARRPGKGKKAPPPKEEPPARGKGKGKKRPSGRERPSGVRKAAERPSRESAELREFFKPEGISLGVKFVLTISIMVFLIMIVFSAVVYALSVSSLKSEMEDNGALMLKAVESIADSYFEYLKVSEEKTRLDLKPETDEAAQARFDKVWGDLAKSIRKRYTTYLNSLLEHESREGDDARTTKILNAMIKAAEKDRDLNPRGGSKLVPKGGTIYRWLNIRTDIKISGGKYKEELDGRLKSFEMVLFTKDISGGRGKAFLAMSAEKIAKTRNSLLVRVVLSTLVAIIFGVGVSFVLASLVSKPVNKLIDDITMVSRGKLDHKTIPTSKDEIGVLARTFDAMTQNLKVAQDREIENQAREHDMKIATEIQAGLLPSKIPAMKGYDLDAYYRPSKEVGGDYYDYINIDQTHLGITVADVSGKGIPGSMVMTMARSLLRMEASRNLSTSDTLKKVNKVVARDIRRGMFVTALYLILDIPKRTILVSSAGHNPLIVFRGKTKKLEMVNPNGIALGFDKGPIFDRTIKEELVQLAPGDRVVLYTDGVVEAMDENHEEYSDERFNQVCQKVGDRNSNQFINILVGDLGKHQGKADQHDDITVSTFRVV
jgi:serine phosphatase RsbU (regulator of sigma subunit)